MKGVWSPFSMPHQDGDTQHSRNSFIPSRSTQTESSARLKYQLPVCPTRRRKQQREARTLLRFQAFFNSLPSKRWICRQKAWLLLGGGCWLPAAQARRLHLQKQSSGATEPAFVGFKGPHHVPSHLGGRC